MISTPLFICLAVASAVVVIALMMWKPRLRFPRTRTDANWPARDVTFASMLVSFAAAIGLARAQAEGSRDAHSDSHGWHGSHLDHGASGGFSDGGGFSGGDAGGGGI